MANRRLAIVIGLGIVQIWIIGLMIRSIAGGSHNSNFSAAAAHLAPAALQAATAGQNAKTFETGSAPHVVIDDANATLTVSVRTGTTVDAVEQTQVTGWMRGPNRPALIERTSDGVRIARPDNEVSIVAFGSMQRRLDVVVPPDARLDVENAGPTTVSGLRADVTLHSDDGSIEVSDQRGAVDIKTDNGRIKLNDVQAASVDVSSDNGRVMFDRVSADSVAVVTDNGRIEISRSLLRAGKIQTDSGHIRLELDPHSDVTVNAHTSSGKVVAKPPLTAVAASDEDDAPTTVQVGSGSGRLDVGSDDGSITVLARGV